MDVNYIRRASLLYAFGYSKIYEYISIVQLKVTEIGWTCLSCILWEYLLVLVTNQKSSNIDDTSVKNRSWNFGEIPTMDLACIYLKF